MSQASEAFKKVKLQSISKLKHEADKVCSQFVRKSSADKEGIAACYTCGAKKQWKELQCGHFVSRNNSATRYSAENLRVQCAGCNIWGRGKLNIFADNLLQELGTKRFKELLKKGRETHQFNKKELLEIIEQFKEKISKLCQN